MTVLDKWAQNSSLGWPGMIHCLNTWFITVPRKTSLTKQVLLPNAIMETSRRWKHSITTLQEDVQVKSQCLAGAWQCSSVGKVFAYHGWLCPWLDALSCRDWLWQCTVVIPGWEPGSRTIRRSRQSLGAQPVCGQAGYHPPQKNQKVHYIKYQPVKITLDKSFGLSKMYSSHFLEWYTACSVVTATHRAWLKSESSRVCLEVTLIRL